MWLLSLLWTVPNVVVSPLGVVIHRPVGKKAQSLSCLSICLAVELTKEICLILLLKNLMWTVLFLEQVGNILIILLCMWNALWAKLKLRCLNRCLISRPKNMLWLTILFLCTCSARPSQLLGADRLQT